MMGAMHLPHRFLLVASLALGAACAADDTGSDRTDDNAGEAPSSSTPSSVTDLPSLPVGTTADTPRGRYVDEVFDEVDMQTDIAYGEAIDLQTARPVTLLLDLFEPAGDSSTARAAIVWVHGGGFRSGNKEMLTDIATDWARRGYVTASIDYRLDPGGRCQDVLDGRVDEAAVTAERERCQAAIAAAEDDTRTAIRWLREHADDYGVDADRIVVGGFSAGAVTAVNVAVALDAESAVQAALAASGCSFSLTAVDPAAAPLFLVASEFDAAVPFDCTTATEQAWRDSAVEVQTLYFMGEGTHARALYLKYLDQVDPAWVSFLVDQLDLV